MIDKNNHMIEYDFMRVIFMLMTLGVHVSAYTIKEKYLLMVLNSFLVVCNPLFLMLSGKLNLGKRFKEKKDYVEYYKKKFISIIIPFFIFSISIQLINNGTLNGFFINILSNKIESTYWFIYTLIGILILSPIYSKILQNINENKKKYFLFICIIANFIIMLFDFFEISDDIKLENFAIFGWHFYYFSGYIIEDIVKEKDKKIIYIFTTILFVSACIINIKIKYYYQFKLPGIVLTFLAFSIYLLIKDFGKINNKKISDVISFIARYSYVFYLAHMIVLVKLLTYFNTYNFEIGAIRAYILIFVITIFTSIIVQTIIIKPIQKVVGKILKSESKNKMRIS